MSMTTPKAVTGTEKILDNIQREKQKTLSFFLKYRHGETFSGLSAATISDQPVEYLPQFPYVFLFLSAAANSNVWFVVKHKA